MNLKVLRSCLSKDGYHVDVINEITNALNVVNELEEFIEEKKK